MTVLSAWTEDDYAVQLPGYRSGTFTPTQFTAESLFAESISLRLSRPGGRVLTPRAS
ncbi:MAG: hypothetical protein MZU97_00410 [Bacillus subtilis]|nr:hypothetical protein [Bacillus subtilis]